MKDHFDKRLEAHERPKVMFVEEQLESAKLYKTLKAARNRDGALGDPSKLYRIKRTSMKRTSILFMLPY